MKTLKKLKYFFESNLDGYDVALAIISVVEETKKADPCQSQTEREIIT